MGQRLSPLFPISPVILLDKKNNLGQQTFLFPLTRPLPPKKIIIRNSNSIYKEKEWTADKHQQVLFRGKKAESSSFTKNCLCDHKITPVFPLPFSSKS